MNRSTPGLPVHHHLLEFTQTHVHRVRDAIQPSHPRSSPSLPALNPSQHQSQSMAFPRQEHWSGLPCPPPEDLPNPEIKPMSLTSLALAPLASSGKLSSAFQFSPVAQSCPTLCNPMNQSMPGLPVHHRLPEFTQIHVHCVGDAIQPSHPLSSPSPPTFNLSQHQGLFK